MLQSFARLSVALLLAGCGSRSALAHIAPFDRNDALIAANGTIVVKGFGGGMSGSVVCVIPGSPYSFDSRYSVSGGVSVPEVLAASAKEGMQSRTALAIAEGERLRALKEVMSQLCIAYGNGLFGTVGDTCAASRYGDKLNQIVAHFDGKQPPPALTDEKQCKADADAAKEAAKKERKVQWR